ncbi:FAD-dependent oxidoreductase [Actinosynnema sp. NPDC050801]|uniref:FAD-dependent oxidoreductase n=1 Tax=unclassified Actinosynnema TaxID=2637065 RepID=UPI0033C87B59
MGSGISGLTTALKLSDHVGVRVVVHEQADHFGGRAGTDENGEHCPRFFMDDYSELLAILRTIRGYSGRSVFDDLEVVRRLSRTAASGWVEISHLYRFLAKEIPWSERVRLARTWRRTPLVAEQGGNRYGSLRNYSPGGLARMGANLLRSKTGYVLPGPTDDYLVKPWLGALRARGVVLRTGSRVTALAPGEDGVVVTAGRGTERFDAVVVTAFVPDLVNLLNASRLDHTVVETEHTHCVAYTIDLDRREKVLAEERPRLYSHSGINVLVQPRHHRCVVLCTLSPRTARQHVVAEITEFLQLERDPVTVKCRPNQRPGEAVFVGDYLHPEKLLRRAVHAVYFAGSAMRNSYPLDSAEGAVRSALTAVDAIRHDFNLGPVNTGMVATRDRPRTSEQS